MCAYALVCCGFFSLALVCVSSDLIAINCIFNLFFNCLKILGNESAKIETFLSKSLENFFEWANWGRPCEFFAFLVWVLLLYKKNFRPFPNEKAASHLANALAYCLHICSTMQRRKMNAKKFNLLPWVWRFMAKKRLVSIRASVGDSA